VPDCLRASRDTPFPLRLQGLEPASIGGSSVTLV
jgi:hypothetical protein